MILERYTTRDLKKMIKDYDLEGPEMPERGYYKKEDYVNYVYKLFKLKEVIEDAKDRKIPIKDIMDYYIEEMEKIEEEAQISPQESKVSEEEEGVEEIEYEPEQYVAPERGQYRPPPTSEKVEWKFEDPDETFFYGLLRDIEEDYAPTAADTSFVDEMAFKEHLKAYLIWKYKGHRITFQPKSVDLIIDDKFGLELKFAYNRSTLSKGYEEVKRYKRKVKYLAIVILDPGKLPRDYFNEVIEDYKDMGAEVIVIRGGKKRDFRKKKEIWAAQRIK
ncbi:hypothetical protein [Aciduliprofundum sp. MAR08-339]|uniref:hypothetical protein n=1 Tax=Aciduliprofundum sp. (strain MAR08-339) TaxID=673860 RepID=UPI001389AC23